MAKVTKQTAKKKPEQMDAAEKKKALESAISQIEKDYGEGAIMRMGSKARYRQDR